MTIKDQDSYALLGKFMDKNKLATDKIPKIPIKLATIF